MGASRRVVMKTLITYLSFHRLSFQDFYDIFAFRYLGDIERNELARLLPVFRNVKLRGDKRGL